MRDSAGQVRANKCEMHAKCMETRGNVLKHVEMRAKRVQMRAQIRAKCVQIRAERVQLRGKYTQMRGNVCKIRDITRKVRENTWKTRLIRSAPKCTGMHLLGGWGGTASHSGETGLAWLKSPI